MPNPIPIPTSNPSPPLSLPILTPAQIPHHLLALYGTGASPSALQSAYDTNATYQRPVLPPHRDPPLTLQPWPEAAKPYLGREEYYPDFLRFFQSETQKLGGSWQAVMERYLFGKGLDGGDGGGDEMLVRLFAGFLHPLIQLMYGVEWAQEAVVAEALAQTAVHSGDIGAFLLGAERAAAERRQSHPDGPAVMELMAEVRGNEKLATAARPGDANKVRDGVLVRAKEDMIAFAAKVRVRPEEVEERTAEMFDAALFVAAAAALVQPRKHPKFDFFLM